MADSWEDWEDWEDDEIIVIPTLNESQQKRLEERKLVEESDNALTKELFEEDLVYQETDPKPVIVKPIIVKPIKSEPKKNIISNKQTNKQKQKEQSKLLKSQKAKKQREEELFGDSEYYDEYEKYY